MSFNCSDCNVCEELVGKQEAERVHYFGNASARVLVLDDTNRLEWCMTAMDIAQALLGTETNFTYTTTVRCESFSLGTKDREKVLSSCGVWTHSLLENRSLILTTVNGLKQMRIAPEKGEGDMFRSNQYGAILVIPPLVHMRDSELNAYIAKTKRLLREVGL
jgi:hypothetical protein